MALFSLACSYIIDDYVYSLGYNNLDKWLRDHRSYGRLVEFFTPWCDHCKRLEPEYARAAKLIKKTGENFILAKVDCSIKENKDFAHSKYSVSGFPGIFFFYPNEDEPRKYTGAKYAYGIVDSL
jgi:protein disulfide-isomerase-like protein